MGVYRVDISNHSSQRVLYLDFVIMRLNYGLLLLLMGQRPLVLHIYLKQCVPHLIDIDIMYIMFMVEQCPIGKRINRMMVYSIYIHLHYLLHFNKLDNQIRELSRAKLWASPRGSTRLVQENKSIFHPTPHFHFTHMANALSGHTGL